jgi:uncharacterized membrane protein YeaQ/YmgE (transglycosylase-associated protein family)
MNAIPWMADLEDLSSGEICFLVLMVIVVGMVAGFIVDIIMKDLGLGPAPNAVLALVGVCLGIYLRYRLFEPYRADDAAMTIGFAIGSAFLMFIALGVAKSRVL